MNIYQLILEIWGAGTLLSFLAILATIGSDLYEDADRGSALPGVLLAVLIIAGLWPLILLGLLLTLVLTAAMALEDLRKS